MASPLNMNMNVFLPAQLVVLFRRIVNVISISQSACSWFISAYSLSTHPSQSKSESTLQPDQPPLPTPLPHRHSPDQDTIHRLINNPTLFDPARAPRYPIVLCHGLYGFDVRGPEAFPSLRLHYWSSVLSILKDKLGAEVIVTGVPPTGSIASRAEHLDRILQHKARGRGINLMAHSMGGLDCRHLITHVRPTEYVPLSLTSISTPHRGSPFMDWCAQYLGLGRQSRHPAHQPPNDVELRHHLDSDPTPSPHSNRTAEKRETAFRFSTLPSSFTTLLLSLLDSPAYANLTTSYLNDVFNPSTPDDSRTKYFSVASRIDEMNIWHPLWFPKMVLDDAERKARERLKVTAADTPYSSTVPLWENENEWGNDGLVTVQSAQWGEFLGVLDGCDHWEIRGARGMEMNVELPPGIGNLTNRVAGEGWGLGDWAKFIGAWKKQDKNRLELAPATGIISSQSGETERITQDGRSDPVVKASTDKLSAVFDWIVDHVPTSGNMSFPKEKSPPKKMVKSDLATKYDLERFYVALTRKLYDEGL